MTFSRPVVSAGRFVFHVESQPEPVIIELAPAPDAGGLACVPMPAFTNRRNRPTVVSYLSR
jgi:hypothetical protein